jgi:hypothetical protein
MFKLRKEHMDALDAAVKREADRNLITYARRRFPEHLRQAPAGQLQDLIGKTRGTAKTYGIEQENDVGTFLDFTVMYGEAFHRSAWASDILSKKDVPAPERIALLRHRVASTPPTPEGAADPTAIPPPQQTPTPLAPLPAAIAGAAPLPAIIRTPPPHPPAAEAPPNVDFKEVVKARDEAVEQIAKLPAAQRNRVAAVCGALNTKTGQVALGVKILSTAPGKTAEDLAVAAAGGNAAEVKLTASVRPRTRQTLPVSRGCQKRYGRALFPDGTIFEE